MKYTQPNYVYSDGKKFMNPELSEMIAWIVLGVEDEWIRGKEYDAERTFWADRIKEAKDKIL